MDADKPRRPWRKKKRWRLTAALWLALPVLYPLSSGPYYYCVARSWVPGGDPLLCYVDFYSPVRAALQAIDEIGERVAAPPWANNLWTTYNRTCINAGARHAASD